MHDYVKKRRISKRTATTRLFTDDEREVQRRATNEGKDRSEIIRQAVSNAFRTERLALARKDETMQPVIDTYRKFMDEATQTIKYDLRHMAHEVERMWLETKRAFDGIKAMEENMQIIATTSRYNTEQAIVIRALMQLYVFHVHQQLEMQCGVDPAMSGSAFKELVTRFRSEAGSEMAQILEVQPGVDYNSDEQKVIDQLYNSLMKPIGFMEEPRW